MKWFLLFFFSQKKLCFFISFLLRGKDLFLHIFQNEIKAASSKFFVCEITVGFIRIRQGYLARLTVRKNFAFESEVITEPECRNRLRKESMIFAEAGPGVGFLNETGARVRI